MAGQLIEPSVDVKSSDFLFNPPAVYRKVALECHHFLTSFCKKPMNKSYIHRSDSNQDYDYIVILVFFAFKFYVMKTEYLKHEIGGELIVKT